MKPGSLKSAILAIRVLDIGIAAFAGGAPLITEILKARRTGPEKTPNTTHEGYQPLDYREFMKK